MMRGTHARDDGSFGRSASSQTLKGAALLFAAVLIGIILLHTAPRATTSFASVPGSTATTLRPTATTTPANTTPTTTAPRPPSQVRLLVANGAGVTNLGARVRSQLNSSGYNTTKAAIDAPESNHATTSIYFEPGFQADAEQLATVLSLDASVVQPMPTPPPVPAADLTNVDILVIAGTDIAQTGQTTSPPGQTVPPTTTPASHTTTTVHHTTTTVTTRTTSTPTTAASHTTTTA